MKKFTFKYPLMRGITMKEKTCFFIRRNTIHHSFSSLLESVKPDFKK